MATTTYVVKHFGRGDEGDWNVASWMNECHQVWLELRDDGSFTFAKEHFYSDWGDRLERRTWLIGRYERTDSGIECKSARERTQVRTSDHEMGTSDEEDDEKRCVVELSFPCRGEGVLLSVAYEPLIPGLFMSADVPRHPGVM